MFPFIASKVQENECFTIQAGISGVLIIQFHSLCHSEQKQRHRDD